MVLAMETLLGEAALMGKGAPPAMSREQLEERDGRVAAPCPSAQRWPARSSPLGFTVTREWGPCFGVWVQHCGSSVQPAMGATFPASAF